MVVKKILEYHQQKIANEERKNESVRTFKPTINRTLMNDKIQKELSVSTKSAANECELPERPHSVDPALSSFAARKAFFSAAATQSSHKSPLERTKNESSRSHSRLRSLPDNNSMSQSGFLLSPASPKEPETVQEMKKSMEKINEILKPSVEEKSKELMKISNELQKNEKDSIFPAPSSHPETDQKSILAFYSSPDPSPKESQVVPPVPKRPSQAQVAVINSEAQQIEAEMADGVSGATPQKPKLKNRNLPSMAFLKESQVQCSVPILSLAATPTTQESQESIRVEELAKESPIKTEESSGESSVKMEGLSMKTEESPIKESTDKMEESPIKMEMQAEVQRSFSHSEKAIENNNSEVPRSQTMAAPAIKPKPAGGMGYLSPAELAMAFKNKKKSLPVKDESDDEQMNLEKKSETKEKEQEIKEKEEKEVEKKKVKEEKDELKDEEKQVEEEKVELKDDEKKVEEKKVELKDDEKKVKQQEILVDPSVKKEEEECPPLLPKKASLEAIRQVEEIKLRSNPAVDVESSSNSSLIMSRRSLRKSKTLGLGETSLYCLIGSKRIYLVKVPLASKMKTEKNVLILYTPDAIFMWAGEMASEALHSKGAEIAYVMKEEREKKCKLFFIDEYCESNTVSKFNSFFLDNIAIPSEEALFNEQLYEQSLALYGNEQNSSDYLLSQGKISANHLASQNSFVLQTFNELFVWHGKKASDGERSWAENFAKMRKKMDIKCFIIAENEEPYVFREKFTDWIDTSLTMLCNDTLFSHSLADLIPFYSRRDAGSCAVQKEQEKTSVLKIGDKEKLMEHKHAFFFSSEAYLIKAGDSKYCWKGDDYKAEISSKLMENHTEVQQYRESDQFLKDLSMPFVMRRGDSSGIKSSKRHVFKCFYYNPSLIMKLIESGQLSLSSWTSFIISFKSNLVIWHGKHSLPQVRDFCKKAASLFSEGFIEIEQGREPSGFWEKYDVKMAEEDFGPVLQQRLFKITSSLIEEISMFKWSDLNGLSNVPTIFLLDSFSSLSICHSRETKRESSRVLALNAMEMSLELANYLQQLDSTRNLEAKSVFLISAGRESECFKSFFPDCSEDKRASTFGLKSFFSADKKANVFQKRTAISVSELLLKMKNSQFSAKEITAEAESLPFCLDHTKLDLYLKEEDFIKVFGKSKEEWMKYPEWRKIEMRKQAGILL